MGRILLGRKFKFTQRNIVQDLKRELFSGFGNIFASLQGIEVPGKLAHTTDAYQPIYKYWTTYTYIFF